MYQKNKGKINEPSRKGESPPPPPPPLLLNSAFASLRVLVGSRLYLFSFLFGRAQLWAWYTYYATLRKVAGAVAGLG